MLRDEWKMREEGEDTGSVTGSPEDLNLGCMTGLWLSCERRTRVHSTIFSVCLPPLFDELLDRLSPRLEKEQTFLRTPLTPGLKLALTLRHFASGHTYSSMTFSWRVPHNTISVVVREVCQAIIDEFLDELMTCPTTPQGWQEVADRFLQRWNFPHTCGAVDGKHLACRCPPDSGSTYFNYKGFYSILLFALVDADYKFLWADLSGKGAASDAQVYNDSELKQCIDDGTIGFPDPEPLPVSLEFQRISVSCIHSTNLFSSSSVIT